jgi:hypothetical protein
MTKMDDYSATTTETTRKNTNSRHFKSPSNRSKQFHRPKGAQKPNCDK